MIPCSLKIWFSRRESTKQSNKRTAEQMEAAHKVSLAKGEVGIRDRKPTPTLREFAESDFLPFVRATFAAKPKTLKYYEYGVKSLLAFERIADSRLDTSRNIRRRACNSRLMLDISSPAPCRFATNPLMISPVIVSSRESEILSNARRLFTPYS